MGSGRVESPSIDMPRAMPRLHTTQVKGTSAIHLNGAPFVRLSEFAGSTRSTVCILAFAFTTLPTPTTHHATHTTPFTSTAHLSCH